MQKSKPKRKHSEVRVVWWRFLGLWVLGAIGGWALASWSSNHGGFFYATKASPLILVIMPGLSLSLTQALSLPKAISGNFAWWLGTSAVGYFLVVFSYSFYSDFGAIGDLYSPVFYICICLFPLTLGGIPAFLQWLIILRETITLGWLWPLLITIWNSIFLIISTKIQTSSMTPYYDVLYQPLFWADIFSALLSGLLMLALINLNQAHFRQLAEEKARIQQP